MGWRVVSVVICNSNIRRTAPYFAPRCDFGLRDWWLEVEDFGILGYCLGDCGLRLRASRG